MHGILCVDKPQEMTSFVACARVRRLLGVKKTGHAGTLDPMATGVLPVMCGCATRALDFLPSHDKRYLITVKFGMVSDTQDIWGVTEETHRPLPSRDAVEQALDAFRGDILQTPPMVSAIKQNGVRLYELARQGIEVERQARPVTVHKLDLLSFDGDTAVLDCCCSKGTYMRVITADLGEMLGCGALMSGLRRTLAAGFDIAECLTLDDLAVAVENGEADKLLLPVDRVLSHYDALTVTDKQAARFKNGGALSLDRLTTDVADTVRVYAPDGPFIGLGKPHEGELAIARLFLT
ncbi:MAG: tRNA pseudouridine(55) synthase TruB [Clostridia bacterium]|nr:tRNA pseudouridine(55) synthase TruB [Clostridia bacterium]